MQGACVCLLLKTAEPLGVVTKRNEKEWIHYFEQGRSDASVPRPSTELMPLPELLKAVRKPNSSGKMPNAKQILITDNELEYLKRIHTEFRNQFTHFQPVGWSIEISGIPEIAKLISRIIKDILDSGGAFIHMNYTERESMRADLQQLSKMELLTQ